MHRRLECRWQQQGEPRAMRKLSRPGHGLSAGWRFTFTDFLRRQKAGVSAVEFALISPVLLVILAGTVDIGGSLKAKFELSSAVRRLPTTPPRPRPPKAARPPMPISATAQEVQEPWPGAPRWHAAASAVAAALRGNS
ncbi:TadE/TadG family type IV pilus assembly protein [Mesorhizobium japonicum]|uniref:TadE/TadG family type IV pilus assembly protein n=1 Tax=Mesorhizobium japonicum TaxID=2066070 RepID=UPI003CC76CE3